MRMSCIRFEAGEKESFANKALNRTFTIAKVNLNLQFSIFISSKFASLKSRDEMYQKYLEY